MRMLSSMGEAEEWLLSPRVPKWLLAPAVAVSVACESKEDEVAIVEVKTADGVIDLSDDDGGKIWKEEARAAFRRLAQALSPPPPLKRTILSLASIRNSMTLPVVFQRHPVARKVVRTGRVGPSDGRSSSSSTTGASLLTPPSPSPARLSIANATPQNRGRRTPRRGTVSHSAPAQSVTTSIYPRSALLASAVVSSGSRSTTSTQGAAPGGYEGSASSSRMRAGGQLYSPLPSPLS